MHNCSEYLQAVIHHQNPLQRNQRMTHHMIVFEDRKYNHTFHKLIIERTWTYT